MERAISASATLETRLARRLARLAFVEAGILVVEHHGDGLAEDRIPEKLEPFVVGDGAMFVRE